MPQDQRAFLERQIGLILGEDTALDPVHDVLGGF
jgi:hypothetical protein